MSIKQLRKNMTDDVRRASKKHAHKHYHDLLKITAFLEGVEWLDHHLVICEQFNDDLKAKFNDLQVELAAALMKLDRKPMSVK